MKSMKRVLFILLVAIMMMVVFVSVAFAAAPDQEYPAALDAEATGAEVVSAMDEPPDVWGDYIIGQAYGLIPVLYIIGLVIKKIPGIPDWIIPLALLAIGVIFAMASIGWTIQGAIQGILVAGAAVFGNQLYKQITSGITGDS